MNGITIVFTVTLEFDASTPAYAALARDAERKIGDPYAIDLLVDACEREIDELIGGFNGAAIGDIVTESVTVDGVTQ